MSSPDSRRLCRDAEREESPGSTGQGCLLTAGGSDPKESATEKNRRSRGKGEKAGQEPAGLMATCAVSVNPIRSKASKGGVSERIMPERGRPVPSRKVGRLRPAAMQVLER